MKAKALRDLSAEEQAAKLVEAEQELFQLRMQQAASQLEKPDRIRILRRDVARLRTLLNESKGA